MALQSLDEQKDVDTFVVGQLAKFGCVLAPICLGETEGWQLLILCACPVEEIRIGSFCKSGRGQRYFDVGEGEKEVSVTFSGKKTFRGRVVKASDYLRVYWELPT